MRKLLKSKKIFSILIIAVCVGLFCGARGLQNYYLNQNTGSTKLAAENTKKIDNSNKEKNDLQKKEAARTSTEKSNTTVQQNKPDIDKATTGIKGSTANSSTSKSTGTTKNNNSGSSTKVNSGTGGNNTTAPNDNFFIIDAINNKILAHTYINIAGKTVGDVTRAFLDSQKADYEDDDGYMAMIYGLEQRQYGSKSGWCYYVNDKKPDCGENGYKLSKNDTVKWKYLADGTSPN